MLDCSVFLLFTFAFFRISFTIAIYGIFQINGQLDKMLRISGLIFAVILLVICVRLCEHIVDHYDS